MDIYKLETDLGELLLSLFPNNYKLDFGSAVKQLPTKGNLVFEYNPLLNYRTNFATYLSDDSGNILAYKDGEYCKVVIDLNLLTVNKVKVSTEKLKLTVSNIDTVLSDNIIYNKLIKRNAKNSDEVYYDGALVGLVEDFNFNLRQSVYISKFLKEVFIPKVCDGATLVERSKPGSIIDLDTALLNFSINHPVDMSITPSYDGSVDIILNDDFNRPKLINSRFAVLEDSLYLITNHKWNEATNIYDSLAFDRQTNLIKTNESIAKLTFNGVGEGGSLPIGLYRFYFKLADNDGNESNIIAESLNVLLYKGTVNDPFSISSGLAEENSFKTIKFQLANLERTFTKVNIYYTRQTSGLDGILTVECKFIDSEFKIKNGLCNIVITGNELFQDYDVNALNIYFENILAAKALCEVGNVLMLGNVKKFTEDLKDLKDISLRIFPIPFKGDIIGAVDSEYHDKTGKGEYYNPYNVYSKVSYWDNEIYRFGIVYILKDNSLSHVYNIRGVNGVQFQSGNQTTKNWLYDEECKYTANDTHFNPYDDNNLRLYIQVENNYIVNSKSVVNLENSLGVVRFDTKHQVINSNEEVLPIGVHFYIPPKVKEYMKTFCNGFYFVRLKRIPTILGLAMVIGKDKDNFLPILLIDGEYKGEGFLDETGTLSHGFYTHAKTVPNEKVVNDVAIMPELETNLLMYSTVLNGLEFVVLHSGRYVDDLQQSTRSLFRRYIPTKYNSLTEPTSIDTALLNRELVLSNYNNTAPITRTDYSRDTKVISVPTGTPVHMIGERYFSTIAGFAELPNEIKYWGGERDDKDNYNLARGIYNTVIGLENLDFIFGDIINIMIQGYSQHKMPLYFLERFNDLSMYFSISDRYDVNNDDKYEVFGGDCYSCVYTHKMVSNFCDPETPLQSTFINQNTWKENYDKYDNTKLARINRGDVNAVRMGHWVTFKLLCNRNLCIRSEDLQFPSESDLYGHFRTFYPLSTCTDLPAYKILESSIYNNGIGNLYSYFANFTKSETPWDINQYHTRVYYSDINITNYFLNNYRKIRSTSYRDFTYEYGGITKLINWSENLLVVFEHGIGICKPLIENVARQHAAGGMEYINVANILPPDLQMISTDHGTSWSESVIATKRFVYGIDTATKKIWRTDGLLFLIISDMKVASFLNDNMSLTEFEKTPIIGVRNVKTHYNAFKDDVMFTFYDDLFGVEEKAWNLCYNEGMNTFTTFYSWLPSYSANIHNIYFSFNRTTSKWIAKLSQSANSNITIENPIFDKDTILYVDGNYVLGRIEVNNLPLVDSPKITIQKGLDSDKFDIINNYLVFNKEYIDGLDSIDKIILKYKFNPNDTLTTRRVYAVPIEVSYTKDMQSSVEDSMFTSYYKYNTEKYSTVLYVTPYLNIVSRKIDVNSEGGCLTTDFWKHGFGGIIDNQLPIKPTHWYGELHPFEFEFIINNDVYALKMLYNLNLIANAAEPESFHYEFIGDGYEFSLEKSNIYHRLELTKKLYQELFNSNILFDRRYKDVKPVYNPQSVVLPLHYDRIDTYDELYDAYQRLTSIGKDYQHTTGLEVLYDRRLNQFRFAVHKKASDIVKEGRLRGNMHYVNDTWNIQVPSMSVLLKNEYPNYNNNGSYLLNLIITNEPFIKKHTPITYQVDGNTHKVEDTFTWSDRKEVRIRDKWIKVRIRYSGKQHAIIYGINSLFDISY